jgi:CobQ/CobB/MinD/ParA nucleotide binding domain
MKIHFVIQGKGGVGKSVISALIAQKCQQEGKTICFDTDPVNATFSNYNGVGATFLDIMDKNEVNQRRFDGLMESLLTSDADFAVIDNGASCFIPLSSYIASNAAVDILIAAGHEVHLHTVVTAGQAMRDTLAGLQQVCQTFGESGAKIMVWLNEFWGLVQEDGKTFEQMKVYANNKKFIDSVLTIPELMPKQTFQEDFSEMLKKKLTFSEALDGNIFDSMTKSRLKIIRDKLFNAMSAAF